MLPLGNQDSARGLCLALRAIKARPHASLWGLLVIPGKGM